LDWGVGSGRGEEAHPWEVAWRRGAWKEASGPLPEVVEFSGQLKRAGARRVLDLGAGAGRHTLLLAKAGFEVVSLDVSETALGVLRRRVDEEGLRNVVAVRHEMGRLPFLDGYFDAVVSTNVIHHGLATEVGQVADEALRVTRAGGDGLFVVLSDRDFRYGSGKRLEARTYLFTEGEEKGIVHHFFSKRELRSLLGAFRIVSLDEELLPEGKGVRAHFFVRVKKP
jgi:SAM-dependent methyltransferase